MSVFGVLLVRIFPHSDWIRIQSECGKMRTRITPNTDTFYAVIGSRQSHWEIKWDEVIMLWRARKWARISIKYFGHWPATWIWILGDSRASCKTYAIQSTSVILPMLKNIFPLTWAKNVTYVFFSNYLSGKIKTSLWFWQFHDLLREINGLKH